MRTIKFRAWNKDKKKFVKVMIREDGRVYNPNHPSDWKETPIIIQFTGLEDKKGKEIYEGDIIQVGEYKFRIYHGQFGWCVQNQNGTVDDLDMSIINGEIIGNIYENPELLEGSKTK